MERWKSRDEMWFSLISLEAQAKENAARQMRTVAEMIGAGAPEPDFDAEGYHAEVMAEFNRQAEAWATMRQKFFAPLEGTPATD